MTSSLTQNPGSVDYPLVKPVLKTSLPIRGYDFWDYCKCPTGIPRPYQRRSEHDYVARRSLGRSLHLAEEVIPPVLNPPPQDQGQDELRRNKYCRDVDSVRRHEQEWQYSRALGPEKVFLNKVFISSRLGQKMASFILPTSPTTISSCSKTNQRW